MTDYCSNAGRTPARAPGRFSLWLQPEGDLGRALGERIGVLARRFETPTFEPHVTLIGQIEASGRDARDRLVELASALAPIPIQLRAAEWGADYFHCVYVDVELQRSLLAAHALARRLFGVRPVSSYRPHLSLVYGHLSATTRRSVAREIGKTCAGTFEARAVHLWSTGGPVETWAREGSAALA